MIAYKAWGKLCSHTYSLTHTLPPHLPYANLLAKNPSTRETKGGAFSLNRRWIKFRDRLRGSQSRRPIIMKMLGPRKDENFALYYQKESSTFAWLILTFQFCHPVWRCRELIKSLATPSPNLFTDTFDALFWKLVRVAKSENWVIIQHHQQQQLHFLISNDIIISVSVLESLLLFFFTFDTHTQRKWIESFEFQLANFSEANRKANFCFAIACDHSGLPLCDKREKRWRLDACTADENSSGDSRFFFNWIRKRRMKKKIPSRSWQADCGRVIRVQSPTLMPLKRHQNPGYSARLSLAN